MNPRAGSVLALVATSTVAVAVRVWHLGAPSYWLDEAFTIRVARGSLDGLLTRIDATESTPPLYYLVVHVWGSSFGFGDVAIRSLSVVAGLGTVAFAAAAAQRACGRRIALVTAALLAVNPYLVWYSREARAYALFTCLAALTLWLFVRAMQMPRPAAFAAWAAAAAATMATHYFGAFLLVPLGCMAVVHLRGTARRAAAWWFAGALAAGAALVPLAASQADGRTDWIGDVSMPQRVLDLGTHLLLGYHLPSSAPPGAATVAALAVALVAGAAALHRWGAAAERRTAGAALGLIAAMVAMPIAASLLGHDVFAPRNVVLVALPLAIATACALGAARLPRHVTLVATVLVCTALLGATVRDLRAPPMNRTSWRALARADAAAPTHARRVLVIVPARRHLGLTQLEYRAYRPDARLLPSAGVETTELVLAERHGAAAPSAAAVPGFERAGSVRVGDFLLREYRSPRPVRVTPTLLAPLHGSSFTSAHER